MDTFITVATFQFPHEAYVIRSKLESEGIDVFLKDELTVQNHNFISNAIGGVKLQIPSAQQEKATPILREAGLLPPSSDNKKMFRNKLDQLTFKLPYFHKLPYKVRLIALLALLFIPYLLVILIISL